MEVLAAVSGAEESDAIVETATDLAVAFDGTLGVLHVMSDEEFEERTEEQPGYTIEQAESNAAQTATEAADRTVDRSSVVEPVGRVGTPATQILTEADKRDVRYVVVGGRRRSPVGKAMFGSTTQTVLLNATRPVVTVMQ